MKVIIMYRNSYHGGDGWTYGEMEVEISGNCPICGKPRGIPRIERQCEDGEFYYTSRWENPCGHVDYYKDVYFEAKKLKNKGQNDVQ